MNNQYSFYMFILTYCLIGMVAIPVVAGFLLRRTHLWNGILAVISTFLSIVALLLFMGYSTNSYLDLAIKFLWLVFASWSLVFSIFGILDDKPKAISIIAISTLTGIFILITLLLGNYVNGFFKDDFKTLSLTVLH